MTPEEIMEMIGTENPEFIAWTKTMPARSWARYDLAACRLGWECGQKAVAEKAFVANMCGVNQEKK